MATNHSHHHSRAPHRRLLVSACPSTSFARRCHRVAASLSPAGSLPCSFVLSANRIHLAASHPQNYKKAPARR
uniref:Uncharacterized protein n=1 Tax=Setaria italica TaxID=4555 RepID=K4A0S7_SETIT